MCLQMLLSNLIQAIEIKHLHIFLTREAYLSLFCMCSMKKLKEEMEGVVKELAENNHILER